MVGNSCGLRSLTLAVFAFACLRAQPGDRPAAAVVGMGLQGLYANCQEGYHCPNVLCGTSSFDSANLTFIALTTAQNQVSSLSSLV